MVRNANSVQLIFKEDGGDKTIPNCSVVVKSDSTDIAVVAFPASETGYVPLPFYTEQVTDGTSVWSAGFPGLGDEPSWQLGNGIVSNGRYRNLELTDSAHVDVIQHTAQVDPGSSGGPLMVLFENNKTVTKEEMVGKKKQTVTETVTEKEYKVVGMNTWKAFHRESANFSLMAKDIKKVVDNLGMVSATKNDDNEGLQKQVEKFMESFSKSSSEMIPYISDKMVTSMTEEQISMMLKNISTDANNVLRNGDAVEGLKIMTADNIKNPIRKPAELKVESVSANGDAGTASFSYGKKHYTSTWEKTYDGWQLASTDFIGAKVTKAKRDVESGFNVLDFRGYGDVSLNLMTPLTDTYYFEDEVWGKKASYTDKFKFGIDYAHFFSRFVNWCASFDFGKVERITSQRVYKNGSYYYDESEYEIEEVTTDLKYITLTTGFGVQCPMAVNKIYFAPDLRAQIGFRHGLGDFLADNDHDMGFITSLEAMFNVGYMFNNEQILYIGGGINRKLILSELSDNSLDKLKYFMLKIGYIFD